MNIFFLHLLPRICAQMHVDKHVVKMPLETCQMLCTVWLVTDPENTIYKPAYKMAHKNHPCTIWARTSTENYKWLCQLGIELCKEYTFRYNKEHACEKYIREMYLYTPKLPIKEFTPPAQAMPDIYKDKDPIVAYKHYYFFEKERMLSWSGKIRSRAPPQWIGDFYIIFDDFSRYYKNIVLAEMQASKPIDY